MDHKQFQDWLSGIDRLGPDQRREAEAVLSGLAGVGLAGRDRSDRG